MTYLYIILVLETSNHSTILRNWIMLYKWLCFVAKMILGLNYLLHVYIMLIPDFIQ